ncbi:MAG: hypothetical protein A3H68_02845 [Candidatus Taylorbacteria bacterium RIFCSPLOWO2_02_FULL_46_40]|uniref:Modification methylase NspV n=1 Tax=Candidatus Taylorbacteria bacterium RIFCSPLOWO2_02_FULL_46_40 TaxID=1802329 RepID=A0A1G2NXY5_9BACT|nr:MAG: hypothetical protein A3H68_02845 [Candidatus Taylorbacteria bacterium RIFCSPLOWO2_02_FULL_46_40]
MARSKNKVEFGDFQTPAELVSRVCNLIKQNGANPVSLIEPTCGVGNFVFSALEYFPSIEKGIALDINPTYTQMVKKRIGKDKSKVEIQTEDFFQFNWNKYIANLPEPILVIGNPPWVTNSQISSIEGTNIPTKNNSQKLKGMDALTGKSNFDISEWMMIKLFDALTDRNATLAILCKLSVARKVLTYAWKNGLDIGESAIYEIDAKEDFDASVEACLLVVRFSPNVISKECLWHSSLSSNLQPNRIIGFRNGRVVSDVVLYEKWKHLLSQTEQEYIWRSGIKHDCSRIMELHRVGENRYQNGLGEEIELEEEYIYPLVKSSDLFNEREPSRWVIVTQKKVGDDTSAIEKIAPKTWAYLKSHQDDLAKRTSGIYKNRPPFSIFGIGNYSFSPWKVAISGLYKEPRFRMLGTYLGKPIVADDTVNFVSFGSAADAKELAGVLNSNSALSFLRAMTFVDAKRPYTVDLLKQLDIHKLIGRPRIKSSLFD